MKASLGLVLLAIAVSGTALAAPGLIAYQGRITDTEGNPVTSAITVTFTFWSSESGGSQLGGGFSDADTVTPDADGVYSTFIGDDPSLPVPAAVFSGNNVWLNVNVNGENLAPRKRVGAVAYALQSGNADTVDGAHKTDLANAYHTHTAIDIESGVFPPFMIPQNITLSSSAFVDGGAIRAGSIAPAYIDPAIARDSEILPAVLAGDGPGSGLDADTLDGQQAAAFAASSHAHSGADITSGMIPETAIPMTITRDSEIMTQVLGNDGAGSGLDADKLDGQQAAAFAASSHSHSGADIDTGTVADARIAGTIARDSEIMPTILANDGPGSGLNADLLDGEHSSHFITTSGGDMSGIALSGGLLRITSTDVSGRALVVEALGASGVGIECSATGTGPYTQYGARFSAESTIGRGVQASGKGYDFYAGGTGTNYGPFTGAHEVRLAEDFPLDITPGVLVCTAGPSLKRADEKGDVYVSSTLPTVRLADTPQDKTVLGVIVKELPLAEDHWYKPAADERFAAVNALGDGRVWACTANGDIAMGDYLTTSAVPGYAQKQDDDLQHSYTVGKVTEIVDWNAVTDTVEFAGQTFKAYLIAVVYTCG